MYSYYISSAHPDSEVLKMDVSTNMLLLAVIILELVCTARGNDNFYKREYSFY